MKRPSLAQWKLLSDLMVPENPYMPDEPHWSHGFGRRKSTIQSMEKKGWIQCYEAKFLGETKTAIRITKLGKKVIKKHGILRTMNVGMYERWKEKQNQENKRKLWIAL